jgi:hypothetical protein
MSEISRRTLLAGAALSPLAGGYPIVDSHVHVWKHDPEYPFAPGAHVPARDATPEMLLDLMKANGVSRTVIVQVIHYRYDNRYLAAVLKRYPRLFHGVARVDPLDPAAPDQLSRLTAQGFRGVRLSPSGGAAGDWFRGPLMPPLWKRCLDLNVPGGPTRGIGKTDRARTLSPRVREDFAYLVAFPAAVSLAGCPGAGEAAAPCIRSPAPDVGHGLADYRGPLHLR